MNIAICDDEQQDIDILYNYCKSCKLPYNISTFLSASALLEAFKSQFYDLIFLDIEMDKPNGFEVGSILAGYSPRPVMVLRQTHCSMQSEDMELLFDFYANR